ncbi:MAG: hypothetical protein ABI210_06750 [Abditibacteriaceae bacterium]
MSSKDIDSDVGKISLRSKSTSKSLQALLETKLKDNEIVKAKKPTSEDIRKNGKIKVDAPRQNELKIQAYKSKKVDRPDKKRA